MALNCEQLLAADIERDCDNTPIAGLEVNVLFFNMADINKALTTFDVTTDLLMTNFDLLTGSKSGYLIEGIRANNFKATYELVKTDYANSYKHLISGVILNPSVENRKALESMASGGKFVAIVEKVWKGVNSEDAFEVYGYSSGLKGATVVFNSAENNGVITFEMASEDGYEEPRMPYNVLETDYATTAAAFATKWLSAV